MNLPFINVICDRFHAIANLQAYPLPAHLMLAQHTEYTQTCPTHTFPNILPPLKFTALTKSGDPSCIILNLWA